MATSTGIPLELYLHSVYEPDAEYVDGTVEERPMGEDSHSAWQEAIAYWFRMHAETWKIRVRPELRVQTSATRFRVPDVAILDAGRPREPIATHPPIAVFEVLSPEDTHKRLLRKLHDYAEMGVAGIFVVDPDTGLVEQFEQGRLVPCLRCELPEIGASFLFEAIAALVL